MDYYILCGVTATCVHIQTHKIRHIEGIGII